MCPHKLVLSLIFYGFDYSPNLFEFDAPNRERNDKYHVIFQYKQFLDHKGMYTTARNLIIKNLISQLFFFSLEI
jgi:hypothetical protein